MDDSSRELMANMEQPVSHAERQEHAGLALKFWNMIQMLLMEQVGREAWTHGVSAEFKNLINEKPELVAGFSEATKQRQDEMVKIILNELEPHLG